MSGLLSFQVNAETGRDVRVALKSNGDNALSSTPAANAHAATAYRNMAMTALPTVLVHRWHRHRVQYPQ